MPDKKSRKREWGPSAQQIIIGFEPKCLLNHLYILISALPPLLHEVHAGTILNSCCASPTSPSYPTIISTLEISMIIFQTAYIETLPIANSPSSQSITSAFEITPYCHCSDLLVEVNGPCPIYSTSWPIYTRRLSHLIQRYIEPHGEERKNAAI